MVLIYVYICVSVYWTLCVLCLLVCVCDVKSEYQQKLCHPYQTFSKFDALLHKTHSKVLPVLIKVLGKISGNKSAILPQFNGLEVLSFPVDKVRVFTEIFCKNSNDDDSCISPSALPFKMYLQLHIPLALRWLNTLLSILIHLSCLVLIAFQWWLWETVSLNFYIY